MEYEDFVVQLGPETSQGIEVQARCSVAGEARGHLDLPARPENLASRFPEILRGADQMVGGSSVRHLIPSDLEASRRSKVTARDLGAALFEGVFRGAVRSLLDHSLGDLGRDQDRGLRIKLKLDLGDAVQPRLHSLPWELLYKPDTGDFLGLSRRTPIVRYLDLPRAVRPLGLPEVLRVLALAPELKGQPDLDLRTERRNLETLESSVRGLEIAFVGSARLDALRRALLEGEIHVLHLMGHGNFDSRTGCGVFYLERGDGGTEPVTSESLVAVVKDFPSLRLVVLNACNTARADERVGGNPFSGLAPALMRAGVPAILAMQLPISDRAAIAFSESFYRRLLAGDPLDAAVTEGRQAIHSRAPTSAEWAVPALFLRTSDGTVFGPGKRSSPELSRTRPEGIEHLRVGNYEQAVAGLRDELARDRDQGLLLVALGVALGRGRHLRRLPYQTAIEMHRLFAQALMTSDARGVAARALLSLKLDYFEANAVREPVPTRDDVFQALSEGPLDKDADWLVACLPASDRTREVLARAGLSERRKP